MQRPARLELPANAVRFSKGGIEFRTQERISLWTEMTVAMETSTDRRKLNFTGVVVECTGNDQSGYRVLMVFTNVPRQAQSRLNSLATSRLA